MNKKVLIGLGSLIVVVVLFCTPGCKSEGPQAALAAAREAISTAQMQEAADYATTDYERSVMYYDSAMIHWKRENDKMMIFRDYSTSKYYADQATYWAIGAKRRAEKSRAAYQSLVDRRLLEVQEMMSRFETHYQNLPMTKSDLQVLAAAKMTYQEATLSNSLTAVNQKLAAVGQAMEQLEDKMAARLQAYFQDHGTWVHLRNEAVSNSAKKKQTCLIIDKYARTCQIYKSGSLVKTYEVELGKNWIGDKQFAGDKTTPEGAYFITHKKAGSETKYHKALLINYPNEEDKRRFKANMNNGQIAKNAAIGGLIEVHGHGGKGIDWTDGCIALRNQDADEVYNLCEVGTPVIIIGSLKTLEQILK